MQHHAVPTLLLLVAVAATLPAQQWLEVGDAGDLPCNAQIPQNPTQALTSIRGSLATGADVDMFLVQITDPSSFSATTAGNATFDTQLWLFHTDGRGVTFNDDSSGSLQSTISGTFVPYAGLYYLAISTYDRDAWSHGDELWSDGPFGSERQPDGPHRGESVGEWNGPTPGGGNQYTILLNGCERPRAQIVAPDNHHLTESPAVALGSGSSQWWRTGGGRFQILYDASHFLNAGMATGAWIDKLLFRGEDGQPDAGGQTWSNVTVQLAITNMTPGGMTTDFGTNLSSGTFLGSGTIPTVTVRRSTGSFPNNYNIELDLFVAFNGCFYRPAMGNLLVDVVLPTAASLPANNSPVMPMQNTSGGLGLVRGAGITAAPGSVPTAVSPEPPVLAIGIDGPGGCTPPVAATNENYGTACGGQPSSFFQTFRNGQPIDLVGLRLTPRPNSLAPSHYEVSRAAGSFEATRVNAVANSTADDATVSHPLGFTLNFPGGSTVAVSPCTNGFVWLDGTSTSSDFTPSVQEFLGSSQASPPRIAAFWTDVHAGRNVPMFPNSGMHVLTDGPPGARVCYISWLDCGVYNSMPGADHARVNMQIAIFEASGVIEIRYGSMPSHAQTNGDQCLVGFTRGRIGATPSANPQSRDLSLEVPFLTHVEGSVGNMLQTVTAMPMPGGAQYGGRAFGGQVLRFDVSNVPGGAPFGVQLLHTNATRPGSMFLLSPMECRQAFVLQDATFFDFHVAPAATVIGNVPLAIPSLGNCACVDLYAQYAILDPGSSTPVPALSNALRIRLGAN